MARCSYFVTPYARTGTAETMTVLAEHDENGEYKLPVHVILMDSAAYTATAILSPKKQGRLMPVPTRCPLSAARA
jgi:hypothetical protein